jgi:predicted permease
VLPRDFVFPSTNRRPDALVPLRLDQPPFARPGRAGPALLSTIVRVPAAVPFAEVQTKLDAAMQAFADAAPPVRTAAYGPRNRASLRPLEAELTRRSARVLALVAAASGTLVLLACLTLAGLGIARVEDRAREVALRRAMGASGWAIARLQSVEAMVLAVIGTSIGVALAAPVLTATLRLLPDDVPLLKEPTIDLRVLLFAAGAVLVTSLLIALWPASVAARTGLSPLMACSGQSQSTKTTRGWARRVLVAGEVALALVLTLGGTLVVGSLALLWSEDHGYSEADSLIVEFNVTAADRLGSRTEIAAIETVLGGVVGVRATGAFDESLLQRSFNADVSWKAPAGAGQWCLVGPKVGVETGFFEAMGFVPNAGRVLTNGEVDGGQPVVVLSETAAKLCWEADDPIGRPVTMNGTVFTIVGVVPDVRFSALDERAAGQIYVPGLTLPQRWSRTVLVRTTRLPDAVARDAIAALRSAGLIDQVTRVMTMRAALADSIRARRLNAWLFGVFAAASIAIVAVGILGLIAMATSRRTREIGIRYALGGKPIGVVGLIVREQVVPVAAGLVVGGTVAAWAGQFIGAYLYRFQPSDPRLWTMAMGAVITAALTGTLIPAWRASRVDPVQALRAE